MNEQKSRLMATFDSIAANYDELHFLHAPARRLVELADLSANMRVLDVATGTGLQALLAAQSVGPKGKVIGIDLSPDMLSQARLKLAGLPQVEFQEGDAENLNFPDHSFEAVLCGSALFFIPDLVAALKEFKRVLAPGGCAGFSSFGPGFLQPLNKLWAARLQQYDLKIGSLPIDRLSTPEVCEQLLSQAGFTKIEVRSEQLGYYMTSPEERWQEIVVGIEGLPLLKLPAEQRLQIKTEYLAEISRLATSKGIWIDVPAIFAFGR